MAARWKVSYYLTEQAYKSGIAAFTETLNGDRNFVVGWAQNKMRSSNFKFYDIKEM